MRRDLADMISDPAFWVGAGLGLLVWGIVLLGVPA